MKNQITVHKVIDLIKSSAVSAESFNLITKNVELIKTGSIEGNVVNSIEAERIYEIYERRRSRSRMEGKTLLGLDELLSSLENKKCMVRPVLLLSGKYKITFIFEENMKFLFGAVFSVD